QAVARRYLDPIFSADDAPDTLVLGCTHFPVLVSAIREVLPTQVRIVDSAATTAAAVLRELAPMANDAARCAGRGRVTWLATDGAARFARVGSTFLGETVHADAVEIVDL
ncbi:MAG TPA: hypothetical protein VIJ37_07930, partial [Steroidobacteraceae bacterium]